MPVTRSVLMIGEPKTMRMFRSIMTIPIGTPFQGYEWVSR
jgi:hypothetical protein